MKTQTQMTTKANSTHIDQRRELSSLQSRIGIPRKRRLRYGLVIGLSVMLIVSLIWGLGLFSTFRLRLNNVQYTPSPTRDDVVIVAIDNATLDAYGRLGEWDRSLYADAVRNLNRGKARIIVFDILFAEESINTEADEAFATAIQEARFGSEEIEDWTVSRVIMPIAGERQLRPDSEDKIDFASFINPTDELSQHVSSFGFVNIIPDSDGALRWQPLRASSAENPDEIRLSLSLATYALSFGISSSLIPQLIEYDADANIITVAQRHDIPVDDQGRMLINYFGQPDTGDGSFDVYSFVDVVEGETDLTQFEDKIVLIGAMNATGITDVYPVPIGIGGNTMAGVAIHANAIETLLQKRFLTQQGDRSQLLAIIISAFLSSLILSQFRWRTIIILTPIFAFVWLFAALNYNELTLTLVNLFDPLLAITLSMPGALAGNVLMETRRREWTEILLNSAVHASSQQLNLRQVLRALSDDVQSIMPGTAVQIWLWNDIEKGLSAEYASDETIADQSLVRSYARKAMLTGKIEDFPNYVAVPLNWVEKPLGAIVIEQIKPLNSTRRRLLELFAWQAASVIENAELHKETQDLSELKTNMIRMASHDLKNPIGIVIGYTELLQEDHQDFSMLTDEQAEYLDKIMKASNQMEGIVYDILSLERIRSGYIKMEDYHLLALVRNSVRQYELQAEAKRQTLTSDLPDDFSPMYGDDKQIREAVNNLIGNAIKYTPDEGTIHVSLKEQAGYAVIKVKDTGYGIPKEAQENLFQEFYRYESEDTKSIEGTGLGLSLVKAVAVAHKGKVSVESEINKGSTFIIELPLPETIGVKISSTLDATL